MDIDGGISAFLSKAQKKPVISLILVLILVIGIGTIVGFSIPRSGKHAAATTTAKPKPPTYPKTWDPRIAPLARIASQDRGLKFIHPVYVEFLTDKQFDKQVTTNGSDFSSGQQQQESDGEGIARALGLLSGKVDVLKQSNNLNSSGILAFYDSSDKRIRVRGTKLTAAIKVTLVHELTHALQDQHFGLDASFAKLDASSTEDDFAYDAIVEGDAVRIQDKYESSLPKAVQQRLNKTDDAQYNAYIRAVKQVPPFLTVESDYPYELGPIAVQRAFAEGGNAAVNRLFEKPPVHELQLMQPWLLGQPWTPHSFTRPVVPPGAKQLGSRMEFGAFFLDLVLAERLPADQALEAADGWGGDQTVDYTDGGRACAAISFTGRTTADTQRIDVDLKRWAHGMGGAASVGLAGSTVKVITCDPGESFRASDHSEAALDLLVDRNQMEADLEKQKVPTSLAVCYAVTTSHELGLSVFTAQQPTSAQQRSMESIGESCRASAV